MVSFRGPWLIVQPISEPITCWNARTIWDFMVRVFQQVMSPVIEKTISKARNSVAKGRAQRWQQEVSPVSQLEYYRGSEAPMRQLHPTTSSGQPEVGVLSDLDVIPDKRRLLPSSRLRVTRTGFEKRLSPVKGFEELFSCPMAPSTEMRISSFVRIKWRDISVANATMTSATDVHATRTCGHSVICWKLDGCSSLFLGFPISWQSLHKVSKSSNRVAS